MIFVVSKTADFSTDYFMEWCNYLCVNVFRLNEDSNLNNIENIYIEHNTVDFDIQVGNQRFRFSDLTSVWFRRGYIHTVSPTVQKQDFQLEGFSSINTFLANEDSTLNNFFIHCLRTKHTVNNPKKYNANKLISLMAAAESGLCIPPTLMTYSAAVLQQYFQEDVITKPIQDSLGIIYNEEVYSPVLRQIANVSSVNAPFARSLFQKQIEKQFEIRTFFIHDVFYSAAIITPDTINDYDALRVVPYNLPVDITEKLKVFASKIGIESGSVDLIFDNNGDYYFLEVNPAGQYDFVSKNCNYYLDKALVNFFKKYEKTS